MPRWPGCLLETTLVLGLLYTIAWFTGPDCCDIYLPPRGPCSGPLQKAKQKRTVADMRNTGAAVSEWLRAPGPVSSADRNEAVPAELAASRVDVAALRRVAPDELANYLVPNFLRQVPEKDGWKNGFEYYFGGESIPPQRVLIRSAGCDGRFAGSVYQTGPFLPTDYDQDIVWSDNLFVRWPGSRQGLENDSR